MKIPNRCVIDIETGDWLLIVTNSKGETFTTLIDRDDYHKVSSRHWRVTRTHSGDNYIGSRIYFVSGQTKYGDKVLLHRYVLDAAPEDLVDHIKHDYRDNRKRSLRLCTPTQNACNGRKQHNNKSGFIGVFWSKRAGKWRAQITCNYKMILVGHFDNPESAAIVRDLKAIELHGDYAVLNFPRPVSGVITNIQASAVA